MDLETLRNKFRGVTGVSVTPFEEGGRIGDEGLTSHLEFLLERGVEVVVPCGNTSEFYSLRREEVTETLRNLGRPGGGSDPSYPLSRTDRERVKNILTSWGLSPA